ncbi:MAG: hypothetical protein FWC77_06885 [Defluviitaleaceae bacterium]|nr:hypothetical protein [Defluviitaleaceae bacterium]
MSGTFSNTGKLTRFILRRERVNIGLWLAALMLTACISAVLEAQPNEEIIQALTARQNPIRIAIQGPVFGLEYSLAGNLFASQMLLFKIVAVAIMNIFMVIRHTRGDEEKGRYEVMLSLPVGRLAMLHATMITAIFMNIAVAITQGLTLWVLGVSGIDLAGAFTYGAVLGVSGLFFAALAALCAQLTHSARDATNYVFILLLAAYLLRAVGDTTNEFLALISPIGLIMRAEAFAQNYLLPIFFVLTLAFLVGGLAYLLNARRDIEQGLLPQRKGKAHASVFLISPTGLAWRLNRSTFISWAAGMLIFGVALGGLLGEAELFGESEAFRMMMPQAYAFPPTELFTMLINTILALVCIAPIIILISKLKVEETEQRTQQILSSAVSRAKHLAGYVIIAFIASVLIPFLTTLGLWVVGFFMMDNPISFGTMLLAIMVYVPALWVVLGFAVFIVGRFPRAMMLCWAYYAFIFVAGFFGDLLRLPEWAMRLSPIYFIPRLPLEEVNIIILLVMTFVAGGLTLIGFVFYRRRDIAN